MFKIYHKYLLRKTLIVFFASVFIISLCLVSMNLLKLAKHAQYGFTLGLFLTLVGFLNLFILTFSVPLSILIASLLVFGKLSADNETTAFRASGVRISEMALPALIFSIVVSFLMLYINGVVSPKGHYNMGRLQFLSGSLNPMSFFSERESNDFGDYSIFVDRIEDNKMFGLYIVEVRPGRTANIKAKWGELIHNKGDAKVTLDLYEVDVSMPTGEDIVREHDRMLSIEFDVKTLFRAFRSGKGVDDLTIKELIIRRRMSREEEFYVKYKYAMEMLEILGQPAPTEPKGLRRYLRRIAKASNSIEKHKEETTRIRQRYLFEINKRLVLSASCFAFTMIAVPLGVRVHRGEKSVNILIGIMIALLYYTVIIVIEKSGQIDELRPHLIIWIPPLITILLGVRLFRRLRTGL